MIDFGYSQRNSVFSAGNEIPVSLHDGGFSKKINQNEFLKEIKNDHKISGAFRVGIGSLLDP